MGAGHWPALCRRVGGTHTESVAIQCGAADLGGVVANSLPSSRRRGRRRHTETDRFCVGAGHWPALCRRVGGTHTQDSCHHLLALLEAAHPGGSEPFVVSQLQTRAGR